MSVRYFDIDYRRLQNATDGEVLRGGRLVTASDEWSNPPWLWPDFDALDYGLELDTSTGKTLSVIWEQAGVNDGITMRQKSLRPGRLVADGAFAIWDATERSRWTPLIAQKVTAVQLLWHRMESSADLCCDGVTIDFGSDALHLTLGDADGHGKSVGSSDNVAVLSEDAARQYRVGPHGPPNDVL
ncbi:MAG: hypothetical protein Q8K79_14750 [Solirubrobacteraceae bacterium]|nr:hypothetical protein [Solirubrobacteraceae bacterium]